MRILILALGNDIAGEDIAGFIVADILERLIPNDFKDSIDIIKCIESGVKLMDYILRGYDHIIIIDSILSNARGEIIKIKPSDMKTIGRIRSPHYMGIPDILKFLEYLGVSIPSISIYAITIKDISFGAKVSNDVLEACRKLAGIILEEVSNMLKSP